jgi:malic enzyme
MENFVSQFTDDGGTSYKAIELPDGRVVAPRDAIKWIREQEAAAEAAAGAISNPDEPASAERVQEVTADAAERIAAVNAETENQVNNGLPF